MTSNLPFEGLYPLVEQKEFEQLEAEIKEAFVEVYQQMLGQKMRDLLHYGSPHLANNLELLKKFFLADGLAIPRADTEIQYLQHLMKAWRIKNPKRGFHFLRTYLQMLYPNNFRITQLWQESSRPYPTALSSEEEAKRKGTPHWLTSRVKIEVTDWEETGDGLFQYRPTLQAILGARFLLELYVLREFGNKQPTEIGMGAAFSAFNFIDFNCECVLPR